MKKLKLSLATLMLAAMSLPLATSVGQANYAGSSNPGLCIGFIGIELCIG